MIPGKKARLELQPRKPRIGPRKSGHLQAALTGKEQEVLSFLTSEYLTPRQIAIRRKCHISGVYEIIARLKKKGALSNNLENLEKNRGTFTGSAAPQDFSQGLRLHNMQFRINILFRDDRYQKLLNNTNVIDVEGNTILLYKETLDVHVKKDFCGDAVDKCLERGLVYFHRLLARLEDQCKIVLIKNRSQNIKLVNMHIAEMNNGLARECNVNAEKIRIYSREDGKLWFLIDNSFNLHEAECVHPSEAPRDMREVIQPFFNDLRSGPSLQSQQDALLLQVLTLTKDNQVMMTQTLQVMQAMAQGVQATNTALQTLIQVTTPKIPEEKETESLSERPDYLG